jgi:hypothetical protein
MPIIPALERNRRPTLDNISVPDHHQHTVPQLLLRNFSFGTGRHKQIWVFDKQAGKEFKTAVRNVAMEGGFYDFVVDGKKHSLDPAMTRLESTVGQDISNIVKNHVIPTDPETRVRLATFVAVQKLRTDAQRQQYFHLGELLRKTLEDREGPLPESVMPQTTKEQSYAEAISMVPNLTKSAIPHYLAKSWILYGTTHQHPFYISDNPVTLFNTLNQSEFMGTLGLAVKGIEIYLPLSDTLCLGLLCPTVEAWLRNSLTRMESAKAGVEREIASLRSMISALEGKSVHRFDPLNVDHQNSLQVLNAERQVFSRTKDFSLARSIVDANPDARTGPRLSIAGPSGMMVPRET